MSDIIWETFNGLFVTLHKQGRRVEELETRIIALERCLTDRETEATRPVLSIVGHTADAETCPLCTKPLGGEKLFHIECAARENADAECCEQIGSGVR